MKIYRKIYQQYFGVIPLDSNGRSMEIHHIDGNHSNNDINNLKLVTIQEHYHLHYMQEDWGACFLMAKRMELSPSEVSELATKHNLKRVKNGTNPYLDREKARARANKRVLEGTHNFLGGNIQRKSTNSRIANGTHNWQNQERFICVKCSRLISHSNMKRHLNGKKCAPKMIE